MHRLSYLFLFIFFFSQACTSTKERQDYSFEKYFPDSKARTAVMLSIIRHIYVPREGVKKDMRFEPAHDNYYLEQIPNFSMLKYFVEDSSGVHYFYMIRPARNVHNFKRGVAGKFRLNERKKIIDFEELFNTPMMSEEEIIEKGEFLWNDLMYFGHVDRYFLNKGFIEFPDERTRYDKEKLEWTYEK